MPASVTLTMPVPPSVNQLFRNLPGKGRVKTALYDNWRAHAVTAIRLQRVPAVAGRIVVLFGVERVSLAADIDNRVKAMLDAIVDAGVIANDNLVTAIAVSWLPKTNGLAHVQIMPVSRLDVSFHPSPDGASGGWFLSAPPPNGEDDGAVHI